MRYRAWNSTQTYLALPLVGFLCLMVLIVSALSSCGPQSPVKRPIPTSTSSLEHATVYLGGMQGQPFFALNAADGRIRWAKSASDQDIFSLPTAADGILYTAYYSQSQTNVYGVAALNAGDGSVRWQVPLANPVNTPPMVSGELVYVTARQQDGTSSLEVLDVGTGALRWHRAIHGQSYWHPVIASGILYSTVYSSTGNALLALDAHDGSQRWIVPFKAPSEPVVSEGAVFVADKTGLNDSAVSAFDATTGTHLWTVPAPPSNPIDALSVLGSTIMASSSGTLLVAFQATNGREIWRYHVAKGPCGPAALADGKVFAGAGDGVVYVLDAATGVLVTRYTPDPNIAGNVASAVNAAMYWNSPRIVGDVLILGGEVLSSVTHVPPALAEGQVYAINMSDGNVRWVKPMRGAAQWTIPSGN